MDEKEFNLAILKELRKIAGKVFAKVTVSKEGTYTAAELWNEKDAFGESIVIDYKGTESDIYTAEIGTFKMQVTPQKLWYVLWKFEKLCNVKQADKIRFTYGNAENEIISAKAMYYTGNYERAYSGEIIGEGNYKVVTRKVSLKKLSDKLAVDKQERTYYKAGEMWYRINDAPLQEKVIERLKNEPDYLFGLLSKFDFSVKCELNPIFKALYEAITSERINNTPEQRKSENEAENTVIREVAKVDTSAKEFNKNEALNETEKRMREYHPNYIALIRYGLMYYIAGDSAKQVRQIESVRDYIWDTGDIIAFEIEKLDDVLPKLIKAGRGVLTCDIIDDVPEDYPPEPYNKENDEVTGRNMKECVIEPISDIQGENMRPNYLRQKVFPTESFQSMRKISRFKPRYFVGYTNYRLLKENALKRKRNGNTSVYRALIRGGTGISSG